MSTVIDTVTENAGRSCPLHYRYGAERIASAPLRPCDTLYVVGGLYGNLQALDAIEAMAAQEPGDVTLCFNGDFNWFNVDPQRFAEINRRVLAHHATAGNVEAELASHSSDAGCGCAYPESVDAGTVERSNRIHARLKQVADQFPEVQAQLAALPFFARYQVGACRVGVVHGDADSLAGWRFEGSSLQDPANAEWLDAAFNSAQVDVFASSHTCKPALKVCAADDRCVINNGAAGMPNFAGDCRGLITRISTRQSPHGSMYGARVAGAYVDALPVPYDHAAWRQSFVSQWLLGSDAYVSYFARIEGRL